MNLRPGSPAPNGPAGAAGRWRPSPLLAVVTMALLLVGACFTLGYYAGRAQDAVVTAYASRRSATQETTVSVGKPAEKLTKPSDTPPTSLEPTVKPSVAPRAATASSASSPAASKPADLRSVGPNVSAAGTPAGQPSKTTIPKLDPRKRDYYYFVLATYRPATAERLVAFWKANGLDAETVSDDNAGLVQVIDLRGFTADQVGSAAYVMHERNLRALGRKWQSQEKGPDKLEHMNAAKFTGNIAAPKPASRLKKE